MSKKGATDAADWWPMRKLHVIAIPVLSFLGGAAVVIVLYLTLGTKTEPASPGTRVAAEKPPSAPAPGPPVAGRGDPHVAALIEDLVHREFGKRRQAESELVQIGPPALPQLEQAAQSHRDDEVRLRCGKIIRQINEGSVQQAQSPQQQVPREQTGPRAAGPSDSELERLRRRLMAQGVMLQIDGKRIVGPEQLTRGELVELWHQMTGKPLVEGLPEPPKPSEFSLDLTGSLGVKIGEATDGLRVTEVRRGSRAANGGLKSGDIITAINHRQVVKLNEVKDALERSGSDGPVELEVTRRGEIMTIRIPPR